MTAKHAQSLSFGNPPQSESELLKLKHFPTSQYALGLFPNLTKMRNSTCSSGMGSDIQIFFQDGNILVQSIRKLKQDQAVDIHFEAEIYTDPILSDMINFKCAGEDCGLSFPLKEKTNEKILTCPQCGTETNIWKRLKRIVELKRDHETACKELESKGQTRSAIHFFMDLIQEWDSFIYRPYKEVNSLEDHMKKAILLHNETMEREWLHLNK